MSAPFAAPSSGCYLRDELRNSFRAEKAFTASMSLKHDY